MSKTLTNIQTEVRTYLDEAQQTDFLDTEVTTSINRAYHDVIGAVIEVYDRWYETTTPFTYAIVANQQEYTIDSSIIKITRVEINYNPTSSGSVSTRSFPMNEDEQRGNLANTSTGTLFFNSAYYVHGNIGAQTIGFIPVPTVSDTTGKSISVWGIALPSDLVNAGDNVNIPYADRFSYLVALRAAAQLLRKGQQEENTAANYIKEFEQGLMQMQTFLKDRQSDDMQVIVDVQDEITDFSSVV